MGVGGCITVVDLAGGSLKEAAGGQFDPYSDLSFVTRMTFVLCLFLLISLNSWDSKELLCYKLGDGRFQRIPVLWKL